RTNLLAGGEWGHIAIGNVIAAAGHHHRRRACDGGVRRPGCARRVSVQRRGAVLPRQWRPTGDRNVQRLENPAGNTDHCAPVAEADFWPNDRHPETIQKRAFEEAGPCDSRDNCPQIPIARAVSINVRITAVRKLAVEATDNGLLAPELASG